MKNKEQILNAIKALPCAERSAQNILAAIEPYLLQYDREEMRKMFKQMFPHELLKIPNALDLVEDILGFHIPAPVGGEKQKGNWPCMYDDGSTCRALQCKPDHWDVEPQEKQCTCLVPVHKNGQRVHLLSCPLYQQSLKEKIALPNERATDKWPGNPDIQTLKMDVNDIIRYLRAQQN